MRHSSYLGSLLLLIKCFWIGALRNLVILFFRFIIEVLCMLEHLRSSFIFFFICASWGFLYLDCINWHWEFGFLNARPSTSINNVIQSRLSCCPSHFSLVDWTFLFNSCMHCSSSLSCSNNIYVLYPIFLLKMLFTVFAQSIVHSKITILVEFWQFSFAIFGENCILS